MDDIYLFIFIATFCHCCLYFIDTLFKTCSHIPYLYFLKNTGFQIKIFRIQWCTTVFNRLIQKWGTLRPRLQLAWFSAGTWMAIGLMPLALILLIHSIYLNLKIGAQEDTGASLDSTRLQPMVPGINIPLSEIGYYMVTLLVCSFVHELGHALAAVREDARVVGIGMVLAFIVPIAYVSLEQVELLTTVKQLRILCAGIWHNVVLAMFAALIFFITPWVLLPFYDWGSAVQVQAVEFNSPLYGPGGLQIRDRVTYINNCQVTDLVSWQDCLISSVKHNTPGYCLQSEFIKEHDESVPAKHLSAGAVECCGSNSPRHLCFEYLESEEEPIELPQFSCLNVRRVVELADYMCDKANDCPLGLHCFRPSLENSTKLVLIKRFIGNVVIFLGHPAEIYHTVMASDYINLYSFFPSSIPERIKLLAQYMSSFSFGLAILNIIPCFYFDGQLITRALIDMYFSKKIPHTSVRHAISLCITFVGTFILMIYLVVSFWSVLF